MRTRDTAPPVVTSDYICPLRPPRALRRALFAAGAACRIPLSPLEDRYHGLAKINGGKNRGSRPTRRANLTCWTLCMYMYAVCCNTQMRMRTTVGTPFSRWARARARWGRGETNPRLLGRDGGASLERASCRARPSHFLIARRRCAAFRPQAVRTEMRNVITMLGEGGLALMP